MAGSISRCIALAVTSLLISSVAAHGQQPSETCPWLNAATAAGILGQEVRVTITHTNHMEQPNGAPFDATCDFNLVSGSTAQSLQIAVHTMKDHRQDYPAYRAMCETSPRPLVGVGNEAVACRVATGRNQITEKVISRIRERVFIFAWSMPDTAATRGKEAEQVIRDKLQNAAEQIAGSLF